MRTLAEALGAIERALAPFTDVRALTAREVADYKRPLVAGWEIPRLIDGSDLLLRVLVPKTAPHAAVRVAVYPAPPVLSWPHLEERGLLCLLPDGATHRIEAPGEVALELLAAAKNLVEQSLAGTNKEEFRDEFLSYWARWPKRQALMVAACRPDAESRWVSAWYSNAAIFVGEDDDSLKTWLARRFADKVERSAQRVPLLRTSAPPLPAYPSTVSALLDYMGEANAQFVREHLTDSRTPQKSILISTATRRGNALFGFRVSMPQRNRRGGRSLQAGFRGVPPDDVLLARYSGLPLVGADVVRVDPGWVHGRDANPDRAPLAKKSIVVLGVGALGSGIASLLAQAGVGRMALVDPQTLGSENASRHQLGINQVGVNKATGLATELGKRFPHLAIEGFALSAAGFAEAHPDRLADADVVICAIAQWADESWFNTWALEHRRGRPTLFAWLEPHAAAGHAIVTSGLTSCFRCLFDELGNFRCPVTRWANRTTRDIPACGGEFQPYGAVELNAVQGMVADLSLDVLLERTTADTHRVWLAREAHVKGAGGTWNPDWMAAHGQHAGGVIQDLSFQGAEGCGEHGDRRQ